MHAGVEQGASLGMLDQVGRDRQHDLAVLAFDHVLQPADQAAAGNGIELRRHGFLASLAEPSTRSRWTFQPEAIKVARMFETART